MNANANAQALLKVTKTLSGFILRLNEELESIKLGQEAGMLEGEFSRLCAAILELVNTVEKMSNQKNNALNSLKRIREYLSVLEGKITEVAWPEK